MSVVKFTHLRSNLLQPKVIQRKGTLSTDLFCKSAASFQYLQYNSYHPLHASISLQKYQFKI